MRITFGLITLCLFVTSCGSDDGDQDPSNRDGKPVWIQTEGYVDQHFYTVGVYTGGEDQTLPDRVNGAQMDATNKMRAQLSDHSGILIDNWAGTMVETSRIRVDDEIMERTLSRIVDNCTAASWQVQRWIDPETGDNYVLLKVDFDSFVEIIKKQASQLIALEMKDHSRRGHIELDREIENFRRRRIGG